MLTGLAAAQTAENIEITGQVRDYQALPVEGADVAIVQLYRDDFYSPTSARLLNKLDKTDREGRFVIKIEAEPYRDICVVARRQGLALGWGYLHKARVIVTRPDGHLVDIVLPKPYELAGRLVDTSGKAVAGASIQAFTRKNAGGENICAPKDWFSVKTDSAGRFVFDNLPLDLEVKFFIEAPGRDVAYIYPPRELQGNAAGGYHVDWEDIELTLPPATTVRGRVTDKGTGQGVKDLSLLIFTSKGAETEWRFRSCEQRALEGGLFEFKGVPPGNHILRPLPHESRQNSWVGRNVSITVSGTDETVEAELLVEEGVPLEVVVRDQTTGKALPNMKVQVDNRWNDRQEGVFSREARADANGVAHLVVPRGRHKLHAWGGNHESRMNPGGTQVNVNGPRTNPVEVFVGTQSPLVRGIVVDTQGGPVRDAHVNIALGQKVLTDNNGRFEGMQNPLYPARMVAARDIENSLAGAKFFHNAQRELVVVLRPGSSIRGRVIDEASRGIAGASVSAGLRYRWPGRVRDAFGQVHMAETRTDSQGYYRLEAIMPLRSGFHYDVSFNATEFGSTMYTLKDSMRPGEEVTIPDMKLAELDGFVTGVVLDANDNPVADKPVFASSGSGGGPPIGKGTCTDQHGRFKFKRIPDGPITIQAGSGMGPDAAYINAHSGDDVTVRLGNHFKNYVAPLSLVGGQLPDLRILEIGFDYKSAENSKILVVFIDYANRPSQVAVDLLKRRHFEFRRRGVEVVCIQVAPVDERDLAAWKKENRIPFPIYVLPGRPQWDNDNNLLVLKQTPKIMDTLRQQWGVRYLPWTILTDENHKILATGLSIPRILQMLYEQEPQSSPGRISIRK